MSRSLIGSARTATSSRSAAGTRPFSSPTSLRFSASSDRFVTGSAISYSSTMTFACWVNRQSVGFGGVPRLFDVSGNGNAAMAIGNAGAGGVAAGVVAFGAWLSSGYVTRTGVWTHICGVCNGTTSTLYINGQQVYNHSNTAITTGTGILRIGNVGGEGVDAYLKDAIVWNTNLTAAQVYALYNVGTIPGSPQVVFHFNGGSGSTARDSSGNGNDGTMTGCSWSNTVSPFVRLGA